MYTNACEWECPNGYVEIFDSCIFNPIESGKLSVFMQIYVSSVYPPDQKSPEEPEFLPQAFKESVATFLSDSTAQVS